MVKAHFSLPHSLPGAAVVYLFPSCPSDARDSLMEFQVGVPIDAARIGAAFTAQNSE